MFCPWQYKREKDTPARDFFKKKRLPVKEGESKVRDED